MSVLVIVAVRDSAVDGFSRPFFVPAVGAATRSFSDEINRDSGDNAMFSHPDDYDLYELGSFDDQSGKLESLDSPRLLLRGKDAFRSDAKF